MEITTNANQINARSELVHFLIETNDYVLTFRGTSAVQHLASTISNSTLSDDEYVKAVSDSFNKCLLEVNQFIKDESDPGYRSLLEEIKLLYEASLKKLAEFKH